MIKRIDLVPTGDDREDIWTAFEAEQYATCLELLGSGPVTPYTNDEFWYFLRAEVSLRLGLLHEAEDILTQLVTGHHDIRMIVEIALGQVREYQGKLADAEQHFLNATKALRQNRRIRSCGCFFNSPRHVPRRPRIL